MSHRKKGFTGRVPAANQAHTGANRVTGGQSLPQQRGAPMSDQDPDRRLGNFETAGEHSMQQPGGKNDANHGVNHVDK